MYEIKMILRGITGIGGKVMATILFTRLKYREEKWKYTNGSECC